MLDHCRTFCRPRQGRKERRCIQRRRAPSRKSPAKDDEDYAVFAQVLEAAVERTQMRLLAYCSLPNHGHLVIWPQEDGRLFPVHAPGGRSRTRNVGTLTAAVPTCTNFAASIAYEYSWNKNGIASVGIDIYKRNTARRPPQPPTSPCVQRPSIKRHIAALGFLSCRHGGRRCGRTLS